MLLAPSVVSLLGFALGLCGLAAHNLPTAAAFLAMSLAADVLDGACARLLGAVTITGGRLDFAIDTALGGALCAWSGFLPLLALPVGVQLASGGRYSGRAAVTVAAVALRWLV